MNVDWLNSASQRDIDQFKSVCNQLLSRTYVVRTLYRPDKGRVANPDYTFLSIHYEQVRDSLAWLILENCAKENDWNRGQTVLQKRWRRRMIWRAAISIICWDALSAAVMWIS